jgi:hypothetical protein
MATICPYCNIEVSESSIEAEDGCCPECGAFISVSTTFDGTGNDDIYEEDDFDIDDDDDFDDDGFGDHDFADFDDDKFMDDDDSYEDYDKDDF